tara:strand:+ start:60 stop:281 length:222 start_codon:yes stop_codon:yes gene_type:complete
MKNKELTLFEKTTLYNTKLGYKNWKERVEATIDSMGEGYLDSEFEKHHIPKTLEQCNPNQLDILNQNKDENKK